MPYRYQQVPTRLEELPLYLENELTLISEAIEALDEGGYTKRHAAPTKKFEGIVYADGSNWNPGSGRGLYRYDEDSDTYVYLEKQGITQAEADALYAAIGHNHDGVYSAVGHTHAYLPLTGGTLTGSLSLNGTLLENDTNNRLKVTSTSGYVQIGPNNTGWCHFYTDRPSFFFGAAMQIDGAFGVYNGGGTIVAKTGTYGSIQVTGGSSWAGYSIDGQFVLMSDGAGVGIYNDIDNEWMIDCDRNGGARIYYNGAAKITTVSGGATITGVCTATSFNATSSERFKKNIRKSTRRALQTVREMLPVDYDWADNYAGKVEGPWFGFTAEQIAKVDPTFVEFNRQGMPTGLRVDLMLWNAIMAIQELAEEVHGRHPVRN